MPTAIAAAADGTVWFTIDRADGDRPGARRPGRAAAQAGPEHRAARARRRRRTAAPGTPTSRPARVARMTPVRRDRQLPAGHADRPARAPRGGAGRRGLVRRGDRLQHHPAEGRRAHPPRLRIRRAAGPTAWRWRPTAPSGRRCRRPTSCCGSPPTASHAAFDLPRAGAVPTDIAVGPDGAVWFLEFRGNRIGRFKDGEFAEFEVGAENAGPQRDGRGRRWRGLVRHAARRQPRAGCATASSRRSGCRASTPGPTASPSIATATSGTPTSAATSACCPPATRASRQALLSPAGAAAGRRPARSARRPCRGSAAWSRSARARPRCCSASRGPSRPTLRGDHADHDQRRGEAEAEHHHRRQSQQHLAARERAEQDRQRGRVGQDAARDARAPAGPPASGGSSVTRSTDGSGRCPSRGCASRRRRSARADAAHAGPWTWPCR